MNRKRIRFVWPGFVLSQIVVIVLQEHVSEMVMCQVVAIDQRGHGDTCTSDDGDLSAETLARSKYNPSLM